MEAKYIKKLWKLKDYEKVKGDLFIRVLNIKRNRDILDGGIYVVQDDFALVVCQKLDEAENEWVSVTVPAGFLDEWGKTREEVLKTAYENTTKMLFVRLIGMDEVTEEPYSAGKELWEVEAFLTVHIYRYSMKTGKLTPIMPDEDVIKSYQQGKDSKWRKEYLDMQE